MSKETTKAKITAFRALTADNSASPEVVGIIMDEILELNDDTPQNLQSVINNGGYAEDPTSLNNVNLLYFKGGEYSHVLEVFSTTISDLGSRFSMKEREFSLSNNNGSLSKSSSITFLEGDLTMGKSLLDNTTIIKVQDPVADVNLIFPAKTVAGDYTIATLDDIPSSSASSLDQVLSVGNTSATPIVQPFGGQTATTSYEGIGITQNNFSGSTYLTKDGFVSSRNTGEYVRLQLGFGLELKTGTNNGHAKLKSDLLSDNKTITFQFPDKANGTYTLATTNDLRPYKICSLLLSQAGTTAPTFTILENTLGDTFTIIYNSVGNYTLRLNTLGLFTSTKTSILANSSYNSSAYLGVSRGNDTDLIIITTFSGSNADNVLLNATLEIKIYN